MSYTEGETIVARNVEEELKESYLRYSMSVIISRALPDVRDGLKPSQRRILYAMKLLNLSPGAKHRKCAKICGDTSGDFHPHGESVIYPTLARMAQPWAMRYPLIQGQGNFGSIDGDPPAAMRYTEARLTHASMALMEDLDKETVDFVANYDETKKEPVVFPAKFPALLSNGSSGIAVGMATNIPPQNLHELSIATRMVLDNPQTTVDEIMEVMPAPDFPTGGVICGHRGVKEAYHTGRGKITLRGLLRVEENDKTDRSKIIVDEIPYNVNKSILIKRIADLINSKMIGGVSDLRDESDKDGMRIVLDLKKGEIPDVTINQLYKYTDLQVTFGCIMLALDNGLPRTMNVKQMIAAWIGHRIEVIRRRTRFELNKAEARAHVLEGYLKALDNLDEIVKLIRASSDRYVAKKELVARFEFSERQADAVLDLKLYQLTGLEKDKIENEYQELLKRIEHFRAILANEGMVRDIIKEELDEVLKKEKLPARRTKIIAAEGDFSMEDLIPNEPVIITISSDDYAKRMPISTFKEQRRGGSGVIGFDMKKETDTLKDVLAATTHDSLLIFTNYGRCHWLKVWQIPEAGRRSKGKAIVNLLEGLASDEQIAAILNVSDFNDDAYIIFTTKQGIIKKTALSAYSSPRRKGVFGITIDDGDEVIAARLVRDDDQVMIFTSFGMAVRFEQNLVRAMGRTARGVRGVKLKGEEDSVVSSEVVQEDQTILIVCENGYGKRTKAMDFRQTNRGGVGVRSILTSKRNGDVVAAIAIRDQDSVLMMSSSGQTIRTNMQDVRVMGRSTQGVRLVNLTKKDKVVAVQKIENIEKEDE
ncbi:MAG: DNA topoisomerase (ATP-hydrolyzing) subunit A [Rhabdochlamydiaceae bacterium]|nr:DNA topoisomerase (ATP-hydrolyzing) subunit A [Candidatus Amphrikana amoebophyrae]